MNDRVQTQDRLNLKILIYLSIVLSCLYQLDLFDGSLRMGEDLIRYHYPIQKILGEDLLSLTTRFGPGWDLLADSHGGFFQPINFCMWYL